VEEQNEPEKQEKPQEAKKSEPPAQEHRIPKLSDYTMQQLWDMYPDDFQTLLNDFQKKAVQKPTEANVKEYITMQDIARRKAVAYTNVQQLVMQKEPDLSLPRAELAPVRDANVQMERSVKDRILASRDDYALIFFYQNGCPYCESQKNILGFLANASKWLIKPVNIGTDPALASRFNVSVTPTILLIKKGREDYLTLGTGIMPEDLLFERMYDGIRLMEGEIKPEQYGVREYQKGTPMDPLAPLEQKGR
jgi:conjugal transfer pilus assembly protein TraF